MARGSKIQLDTKKMQELIKDTAGRDRWLNGLAHDMNGDIVQSFGTGPPGKEHQRGGITHVASQPGYPPNVDIGNLSNSMRVFKVGHLHFEIRDGVNYGLGLEIGTEDIAARPFVRPVFNRYRRDLMRGRRTRGLVNV